MMRAMGITGLGGPEVLHPVDVSKPLRVADGDVIIRVEATSYNRVDALLRLEDFGLKFPIVPGSDVVGDVVDGASQLQGKRVVVNPGIPCGECDGCAAEDACRYVRILGVHVPGGYGEYVKVAQEQCFELPSELPLEVAAAFPLSFLTAWRMLHTRALVTRSDTVLVWGASGGLGSAAIAICRAVGCRVLAVVRNPEHIQSLRSYGADVVIDVSSQDVVRAVQAETDGIGATVVFEGPGAATWERSIAAAAQSARIVTAGVTSGSRASLDIEELYYKQLTVLGSRMGYRNEFEAVFEQLINGSLHPLISGVHSIRDAIDVHRAADQSGRCGKVVMLHDW